MDDMNAEMKQAEKHITGMEKWCGLCVLPWKRHAKIRDNDAYTKTPKEPKKAKKGKKEPTETEPQQASGPIIQRINNDAREDEMEENMQAVSGILSTLKTQATLMNSELEKQNPQLDRLNAKTQHQEYRVKKANARTEKLMKS